MLVSKYYKSAFITITVFESHKKRWKKRIKNKNTIYENRVRYNEFQVTVKLNYASVD